VTVSIYDVQSRLVRQLQLGLVMVMVMAGSYVTADCAAYWDDKTKALRAYRSRGKNPPVVSRSNSQDLCW
jgi:hypothetical protein